MTTTAAKVVRRWEMKGISESGECDAETPEAFRGGDDDSGRYRASILEKILL